MNEIDSSTQEATKMARKGKKRMAGSRYKSSMMKMDVNVKSKKHKVIRHKRAVKR
jgi:hypothetical protein